MGRRWLASCQLKAYRAGKHDCGTVDALATLARDTAASRTKWCRGVATTTASERAKFLATSGPDACRRSRKRGRRGLTNTADGATRASYRIGESGGPWACTRDLSDPGPERLGENRGTGAEISAHRCAIRSMDHNLTHADRLRRSMSLPLYVNLLPSRRHRAKLELRMCGVKDEVRRKRVSERRNVKKGYLDMHDIAMCSCPSAAWQAMSIQKTVLRSGLSLHLAICHKISLWSAETEHMESCHRRLSVSRHQDRDQAGISLVAASTLSAALITDQSLDLTSYEMIVSARAKNTPNPYKLPYSRPYARFVLSSTDIRVRYVGAFY